MPMPVEAALWGLLSGSALVIGAVLGFFLKLPQRLVASVMALGSGVLISAVAFDLMDEAFQQAGFGPAATGFVTGAVLYTLANIVVSRQGARHRMRSGSDPKERQMDAAAGGGLVLAIGALLDGVPESVVIGVSLLDGTGVSIATVAAVFLSNVPEGLSSSAGMRRAGRSAGYVFAVWGGIALASGVAAFVGNWALASADPAVLAIVTALAAGAILAMIADSMIPEAFETTHEFTGLIAASGFLAAFALTKLA
ncbi:ZIP family zinc transporter [Devosia geojensis]|uniref:ZIP family zinc transporter n=1 Tax=Devosia geojensis TaxID=443610 RepID=A0A0F5FXT1_9HYPH|nr:ZIP family zinc transporter [Devosia geojensis]KKB13659.1 ZIP family zinc transporter [Devosia geojensis]